MVDKEEFKAHILASKTIPELQAIYGISRTRVAQYKREFGFVGITPNSRKRDIDSSTKICGNCNKELELSYFYSNGATSTGKFKYKPTCKKCENSSRNHEFQSKILNYLESCGKSYNCEKCNYTGVWGSLDFHHVHPEDKLFTIGEYSVKTGSQQHFQENVVPELDKCIVLCPNCHRQEHLLMGQK